MFSASTSLRTAQVANFVGTPAKSRSTKVCSSRCLSRGKCWFFFFSCFFVGEAKRSQIWWPNGVRGSFVVYVARRRDGREMDAPPFVSVQKYIRRENVCEERDTFAPLSLREAGFTSARERTPSFSWKGKKRVKTSKRKGCFLVFAYPFLLSQKKQISHQILSYVYSFKHRLQSPRCAWLKTKT